MPRDGIRDPEVLSECRSWGDEESLFLLAALDAGFGYGFIGVSCQQSGFAVSSHQ